MNSPASSRLGAMVPTGLAILLVASAAFAQAPPMSMAHAGTAMPSASRFEIKFLEGMIDHHAMAVHMAGLLHVQAVHAELGSLGDSIAATQTAEIKQMQAWLQLWYGRAHEPAPMMAGMGSLETLKGAAFEKEFMRMMIPHHAMAVRQARECLRRGRHPELRHLCRNIVRSQQQEIGTMKGWLCRWYRDCAPAGK